MITGRSRCSLLICFERGYAIDTTSMRDVEEDNIEMLLGDAVLRGLTVFGGR